MMTFAAIVRDRDELETWQAAMLESLVGAGASLRAIIRHVGEPVESAYLRMVATLGRPASRAPAALGICSSIPCVSLPNFDFASIEVAVDFTYDRVVAERVWSANVELWRFDTADRANRSIESDGAVMALRSGGTVAPRLMASRSDSSARVLVEGVLATVPRSYARTVDRVLDEIAKWPAYAMRDRSLAPARPPADTVYVESAVPSASDAWAIKQALALRTVKRLASIFVEEDWNVGIAEVPVATFALAETTPTVRWFPYLEKGEFLADPMGRERAGGDVDVFCEVFPYSTQRGSIVGLSYHDGAWAPERRTLLDGGHHWSYPFLLERNGVTYCIPETLEANEVAAFAEDTRTSTWSKHTTLITEYPGVDSTIVKHEGRWWLFGTRADDSDLTKLYLWYADDPLGPWTPHVRNPVKIDVRSARPAGPLFSHDGILYRPAQDCSRSYGGRIALNRIVRLDPSDFVEEVEKFIDPVPGAFGHAMHTLAGVGKRTLVDGRRRSLTLRHAFDVAVRLGRRFR